MISEEVLKKMSAVTEEERALLNGGETINRRIYMDGCEDVIMGHKFLQPGKLITVRPHTRFVHFPEHTHDYVEIVYMVQGTTTHIVNGTKVTLQAGELLLMGQNTRQEIYRAEQDDLAVNFIVRPEFFQGTLLFLEGDESPLRHFIVDCLCGGKESNFLYFRVADVLPIQHLLENLLWTLFFETQNRREIYQMTMALLFVLLIDHTECLYHASPEQEVIFQVLRYIEGHYQDGSLREIAAELHYDSTGLSREIKRRMGKTYTELVQEKRMAQSAWLLRNTSHRVDEIAQEVGYENIGYFHRLFAETYGMSPKKYRDSK